MDNRTYQFDYHAINLHVKTLFDLARGMPGKFIVLALTGDKSDPPYEIAHFHADGGLDEMERMAAHIRSFCPALGKHPDHKVREPWTMPNGRVKTWPKDYRCKPLNIYVPWAVFQSALEHWKKGSEADVIASLAGTIDIDADKGDSPDIPLKSSGRLTTSPGNFQDFFVYENPLPLADAKPVALALHRMTAKDGDEAAKGDSATKDVSHIWRVPGTLNFPNAAKIARRQAQGIPTEPFVVRWVWTDGGLFAPETIIAAAPAEPPHATRKTASEPSDENDLMEAALRNVEAKKLASALAALNPDVLPKSNPPGGLYAYWLQVGMALHSFDPGDYADSLGLPLWDTWSERSKHYSRDELEDKWASFNDRAGGVTVSSIYGWAAGEGWSCPRVGLDTGWADVDEVTRDNWGSASTNSSAAPGVGADPQCTFTDVKTAILAGEKADAMKIWKTFLGRYTPTAVEMKELIKLIAERLGAGIQDVKTDVTAMAADVIRKRNDAEWQAKKGASTKLLEPFDYPDLEAGPVMLKWDGICCAVKSPEPPMRDANNWPVYVNRTEIPGMHILTSMTANGGEDSTLPQPKNFLLNRHDKFSLELELGDHVTFYTEDEMLERREVAPSARFVEHFLHYERSHAPRVYTILTMPVVLADRTILSRNGLDRDRHLVLRIDDAMAKYIPTREVCTAEAVAGAYRFLCDDWLCDVLADVEGKAIIIAFALSIIERCLFPARPAFFISAGLRGGGKTTAFNMVSMAVLGELTAASAWSTSANSHAIMTP